MANEVMKVDERLARLEVTVATEFHEIGKQFREVFQRFDKIDQRFDGIDQRFDGIDQRLGGVDQRLDGIDHRLDRLEAAFKVQDDRLVAIDRTMTEGFRDIGARIDRLASRRSRRARRS